MTVNDDEFYDDWVPYDGPCLNWCDDCGCHGCEVCDAITDE